MKLLITALLAVFSTNVMAEWIRADATEDSPTYADLSSTLTFGNKVRMWSMADLKETRTVGEVRFLSVLTHSEYDCNERTSRELSYMWYAEHMGEGEVLYVNANVGDKSASILPDSIDEALFKMACESELP